MLDRREPRAHLQFNRTQVYHDIIDASSEVEKLRRRRSAVTSIYEENRVALQKDPTAELQPFPFSELEVDIRRYPIRLSRAGEFFTADLANNSHLPRRPEVPSALHLTPGDLHAAAQWGMLPQLEIVGRRSPQDVQAARAIIDFVEYQTALRQLFIEKHLFDDQAWDYVGSIRDPKQAAQSSAEHINQCPIRPITHTDIYTYSERPPILAERMSFTLLSRLGGRLQPPISVFQPRAGVDRFKKIDILARVDSPDTEPGLVGIDVTLKNNVRDIWDKSLRTQTPRLTAQPTTTTDPRTGQSSPVHRDVVVWPFEVSPYAIFELWKVNRGTTTLTPEYMIPPIYRKLLSRSLLKRMCTPGGQRLYDDATIVQAYATLYGAYEQSVH